MYLIRKLWAVDHPVQRKKIFTKPLWFSRPLERRSLKKEPFNSQFLPGAEREQREALIKFSSMSSTAGLLCSFQNDIAGQQWTQDLNQQLPYKHSWLSHMRFELYSLFYSAAIGHYVHFKYKKKLPSLVNWSLLWLFYQQF